MRLWALRCGGESVPASLLWPDADDRLPRVFLPYFLYLIETPGGRVLFDCGAHPDFATPGSGRLAATGSSEVAVTPDDHLERILATVGVTPADVDLVVLSHLHYDHCGGLAQLTRADVYAGQAELGFALDPSPAQAGAYFPEDFACVPEPRWHPVGGEHDLLGDGALVVLPTPGHTPGHVALLVRLAHRTLLLAGDAAYDSAAVRSRRLPGFLWDADALLESWQRLEELERSEAAEIILTHELPPGALVGSDAPYD
jgi:N-acyl homoserine lactone hydrolase